MPPTPPLADEDESTHKLLEDLWQRLLPQTIERLDLLDQASTAARTETLTLTLLAKASATAHKFAGSLGMFGFHEGSKIALKLEQHLESPDPDPSALNYLTRQLRRSLTNLQAPAERSSPEASNKLKKHVVRNPR